MPTELIKHQTSDKAFGYRKLALLVSAAAADFPDAPTLSAGEGTPTAAEVDGSLYIDATNDLLYMRQGGAWVIAAGAGADFGATGLEADRIEESTASAGVQVDGALFIDGGFAPLAADPGDAGAIPVTRSATVPLTSVGAETRTIAAPPAAGILLQLVFDVDGGNIVITTTGTTVNVAGNNTITFADAGESITLLSSEVGGSLVWRVVGADGDFNTGGLSTV